tara:strand:- start:64 stop:378 length:315 start_codon:yes stop_codon:yes gene_type:complete
MLTSYEKHNGKEAFVTNFSLEVTRVFRKKNGEEREQRYYFDFEAWDIGAKLITENFRKGNWIVVHASATNDSHGNVKFRVNEFEIPKWTMNEHATNTQPEPARV